MQGGAQFDEHSAGGLSERMRQPRRASNASTICSAAGPPSVIVLVRREVTVYWALPTDSSGVDVRGVEHAEQLECGADRQTPDFDQCSD